MAATASTMRMVPGTPAPDFALVDSRSGKTVRRDDYADGTQEVAKAYGAACTPDLFVFDGGGRLFYRGQLDGSRPGNNVPITGGDLRASLDAMLAGSAPPVDQRPSLGCNIKWRPGNEPAP